MITTKQLSLCRDHEKTRGKNYNNAWPLRTSVDPKLLNGNVYAIMNFFSGVSVKNILVTNIVETGQKIIYRNIYKKQKLQ